LDLMDPDSDPDAQHWEIVRKDRRGMINQCLDVSNKYLEVRWLGVQGKRGQYGAEIRKPLSGVRSTGQDIRRLGVEVINPGKKSYPKARSGILGLEVKTQRWA
jgi:hypothetical protein